MTPANVAAKPRKKKGRPAKIAQTQLSFIAKGPLLEAGSVDPFAVPGPTQRQPSAALLVPGLRAAVNAWRSAGYPDASETSRRLLEFWFEEDHPLKGGDRFQYYFAQREAIETIIYCYEIAQARRFRALLEHDSEWVTCSYTKDAVLETFRRADMGPADAQAYDENTDRFPHYVVKLATGGGKTKVMALAVVWSYFHKLYEAGSTLARNFAVIAPNLIVFERLRDDFGSNRIFFRDPLIPPEWLPDFDMQVVLQDDSGPPTATGTLYLTNIHRLYEDKPDTEPANPIEALLPPPVKKATALASVESLIERVAQHDDLVLLNDEAHHVHDEKLAWSKAIVGIHDRLQARGLGLVAQLDFSATPKYTDDGALFEQIVADYPLPDAIAAGIVKEPLLGELSDPHAVPSDDASVVYRQWIDAGVARVKDYEALHQQAGKQPVLFLMAADTDAADQIARYLETLDGFNGRVLTIHTNARGEIAENATGKNKELLDELRQKSREVDSDKNPYRAIVSVLMLREGWDVRNVTVIVGLRAYTAKGQILPEQTIGRGLRLMYAGGSGAKEQVDIIGTPAFEAFVRELKQTDNLEFHTRRVNEPLEGHGIVVDRSRIPQYDILIPQLSNLLHRSEAQIGQIDVTRLGAKTLDVGGDALPETQQYTLTEVLTQKVKEVLELTLPMPADAHGIIWYYTECIRKEARVPQANFDKVYGLVKQFLTAVAFGRVVDLDDKRVWWRLMQDDARATVVTPFVAAINRAVKEEVDVQLRDTEPRPVSQTQAFIWTGETYEGKKTVFTLVPIPPKGGLERDFCAFLDDAPDVAAWAKNTKKLGLTLDYQSVKGHFRLYEPDFVVRLTNGDHWLVETKGQEDAEVARKDARARIWCRDATELTQTTDTPQRWQYVKIQQVTLYSHHGKTFVGLAAHADASAT